MFVKPLSVKKRKQDAIGSSEESLRVRVLISLKTLLIRFSGLI